MIKLIEPSTALFKTIGATYYQISIDEYASYLEVITMKFMVTSAVPTYDETDRSEMSVAHRIVNTRAKIYSFDGTTDTSIYDGCGGVSQVLTSATNAGSWDNCTLVYVACKDHQEVFDFTCQLAKRWTREKRNPLSTFDGFVTYLKKFNRNKKKELSDD